MSVLYVSSTDLRTNCKYFIIYSKLTSINHIIVKLKDNIIYREQKPVTTRNSYFYLYLLPTNSDGI